MIRSLMSIRLTLAGAVVAAVLTGLAPQFVETFSLLQLSVCHRQHVRCSH